MRYLHFSLFLLPTLFLSAAECAEQSSSAIGGQTIFSSRSEPVSVAPFLQKNMKAIRDPELAARARKNGVDSVQASGNQHPWKQLASFPAIIHDVSFRNAQVGYAASEHGLIWKTIDGGKQWNVALYSDSGDYWCLRSMLRSAPGFAVIVALP